MLVLSRLTFKSCLAPFVFAFAIFGLEFAVLIANHLGQPAYIKGIVSNNLAGLEPLLLSFSGRVLILYLLFALVLRFCEVVFAVRHRIVFYMLCFAYLNSYNLLHSPQLYDEFRLATPVIVFLVGILDPWVLSALAAAILVFLAASGYLARPRNRWRSIYSAVTLAALAYYFFEVQSWHLSDWDHETVPAVTSARTKTPPIIVISVDSLNGDVDLKSKQNFPDTSLDRFLANSFRFRRVITPMAQTHGSFTSLLTSQVPPRHGLRHYLPRIALDTDRLLAGSPFFELKKQKYQLIVNMDGREYGYFDAGKVIDISKGPEAGVKSLFFPTVFRSRLVFAFFNNPLGFAVLPEIRANAAYGGAYKMRYFTEEVLRDIRETAQADRPRFYLVHNCVLHYPAAFPYPYYPPNGYPNRNLAQFSYHLKKLGSLSGFRFPDWRDRHHFHKEIYASGIEMVKREFLVPVFDHLEKTGLMDRAIVILMSDHGENLWPDGTLPLSLYPEHGSSLLFAAQAERSFLALRLPGFSGGFVESTVGVVDVLPTLLDFLGIPSFIEASGKSFLPLLKGINDEPDRYFYTETSLWPLRLFEDQNVATSLRILPSLFRVDDRTNYVYVNPLEEGAIMMQKQRAVYKRQWRLTLYLTKGGYRLALCDTQNDPKCQQDLSTTKVQLTRELLQELLKYAQIDAESGFFPRLRFISEGGDLAFVNSASDEALKELTNRHPDRFGWQLLQRAQELSVRRHDHRRAFSMYQLLLKSGSQSPSLRYTTARELLQLCADGVLPAASVPGLRLAFPPEREISNYNVGMLRLAFECGLVYPEIANPAIIASIKNLLRARGEPPFPSRLLRDMTHEQLTDLYKQINPDTVSALNILDRLIDLAPTAELPAYLWKLRSHRWYGFNNYFTVKDLVRRLPLGDLERELKNRFALAASYRLPEDMEDYYLGLYEATKKVDLEFALLTALSQLAREPVSKGFIARILRELHASIDGKIKLPVPLNQVRLLPWRRISLDYPSDIRGYEVGLAIWVGKIVFCAHPPRRLIGACRQLEQAGFDHRGFREWQEVLQFRRGNARLVEPSRPPRLWPLVSSPEK